MMKVKSQKGGEVWTRCCPHEMNPAHPEEAAKASVREGKK